MIISHNSYDCHNVVLVPVIASFDTDGRIRPLYVRLRENSFKVHSSWLVPGHPPVYDYNCQIIDNNQLKPLKLRYHKADNVWSTPRVSNLI